jgi:hypothetical protein
MTPVPQLTAWNCECCALDVAFLEACQYRAEVERLLSRI